VDYWHGQVKAFRFQARTPTFNRNGASIAPVATIEMSMSDPQPQNPDAQILQLRDGPGVAVDIFVGSEY
jgi:hypothetical protein